MANRLERVREGRILGGVATGLSRNLNIDLTLVRLALILLSVFTSGAGTLLYLLAWVAIPEEGQRNSTLTNLMNGNKGPHIPTDTFDPYRD